MCQKYHFRMQSACEWLEDAVSFLQQASLGVDVENYEECLRQQEDIVATEQEFLLHLEELQALLPQLQNMVNPTAKEQLCVSVESAKQRGVEVRDQLQCHQDVLHRQGEQKSNAACVINSIYKNSNKQYLLIITALYPHILFYLAVWLSGSHTRRHVRLSLSL